MNLQPVTGTKFKFQCVSCGQWKWTNERTMADLDGPAFKAYYCGECEDSKARLDLRVDQANGEYQVVADDGRIVGRFPYKIGNETSRGIAHGRANVFRRELFSKINAPE